METKIQSGNPFRSGPYEYTVTTRYVNSGFIGLVWCSHSKYCYSSGWAIFESPCYSESLPAALEAMGYCNSVGIRNYMGPILSGQIG